MDITIISIGFFLLNLSVDSVLFFLLLNSFPMK